MPQCYIIHKWMLYCIPSQGADNHSYASLVVMLAHSVSWNNYVPIISINLSILSIYLLQSSILPVLGKQYNTTLKIDYCELDIWVVGGTGIRLLQQHTYIRPTKLHILTPYQHAHQTSETGTSQLQDVHMHSVNCDIGWNDILIFESHRYGYWVGRLITLTYSLSIYVRIYYLCTCCLCIYYLYTCSYLSVQNV